MKFINSITFMAAFVCASATLSLAQAERIYDAPNPAIDRLVETCLETGGLTFFEDSQTICYNDAIFPEQFLKLREFPEAERIIVTSPGGNVATARLMGTILDERAEPAIIAGQCMSACAMVILPGLDNVHIHHTAHIAVHGITMMKYRTWFGWLKDNAAPSRLDLMRAQFGYDFDFILHKSGSDHMVRHLEGQNVSLDYIQTISDEMEAAALAHPYRVDPKDYWGMLDAEHLETYVGDRITRMEAFAQSWDDPNNRVYKSITIPISDKTYIFERDYEDGGCTAD